MPRFKPRSANLTAKSLIFGHLWKRGSSSVICLTPPWLPHNIVYAISQLEPTLLESQSICFSTCSVKVINLTVQTLRSLHHVKIIFEQVEVLKVLESVLTFLCSRHTDAVFLLEPYEMFS